MKTTDTNDITKSLYKLNLYLIKITPFIISVGYIFNNILLSFNIHIPFLDDIINLSLIPFIVLYISSFVFKFCIYHRFPLYYILFVNLIQFINIFTNIFINNIINICISIIGIIVLGIVYFKYKTV